MKEFFKKKIYNLIILSGDLLIHHKKPENHLLIVRTDAIGDYILFRNFLEEVRKSEKYRDYKITLCGNELWRNLFENFDKDFVDDVIWVSPIKFRKNPFYIYKIIRKIKKAGFDIAINPMYSKTLQTDVLMKASGATEKYQWGEKFFTLSDKYQFEFNINKEFFEKLLNKKIEIKSPNFVNIPQLDLKLPEKFAVIFTGASDPKRRWGLKNFSQIAKIINQRYDYKIVLVGGEKEELDTETINMTGKTSLTELINIISKAKILISNDSSPVHVAIATKTPAICISNGNTFGRFTSCPNDIFDKIEYVYPDTVDDHSFKENFDRFYFGSTVNINEITPEKVLPVIEKILK